MSEYSKQYFFILSQMSQREIKRKYARSYLGVVWSVLNPLLSMAVLTMIFSTMFKGSIDNYPLYHLTGLIIWQFFSTASTTSMSALADNRNMLIKVKFKRQGFVLSRVLAAFVNLGYTCIAYVLILFLFHIYPSVEMLFIIPDILCVYLFTRGISCFLSIIYVFFADVKHLYQIFLTLWMYMSAIFYPVERLPEYAQNIIRLNPVYAYIKIARDVMMYGRMPDIYSCVLGVCVAIVVFILGEVFFESNQNSIMMKL